MTQPDLIVESLRLMGIGMGIVFSFLLLLVGILRLMSAFALRLAPPVPEPEAPVAAAQPEASGPPIAVIAAAIARYRAGQQQ
jgi:oxaloacetate decarboxylase gamma subunit